MAAATAAADSQTGISGERRAPGRDREGAMAEKTPPPHFGFARL
jgi:hypothetical protein